MAHKGIKSRAVAALMAATMLVNNIMISGSTISDMLDKRAAGTSDSRKALQEQLMKDMMSSRDSEGYVSAGIDDPDSSFNSVFGDLRVSVSKDLIGEDMKPAISFIDNGLGDMEDQIYRSSGSYVDTVLPVVITKVRDDKSNNHDNDNDINEDIKDITDIRDDKNIDKDVYENVNGEHATPSDITMTGDVINHACDEEAVGNTKIEDIAGEDAGEYPVEDMAEIDRNNGVQVFRLYAHNADLLQQTTLYQLSDDGEWIELSFESGTEEVPEEVPETVRKAREATGIDNDDSIRNDSGNDSKNGDSNGNSASAAENDDNDGNAEEEGDELIGDLDIFADNSKDSKPERASEDAGRENDGKKPEPVSTGSDISHEDEYVTSDQEGNQNDHDDRMIPYVEFEASYDAPILFVEMHDNPEFTVYDNLAITDASKNDVFLNENGLSEKTVAAINGLSEGEGIAYSVRDDDNAWTGNMDVSSIKNNGVEDINSILSAGSGHMPIRLLGDGGSGTVIMEQEPVTADNTTIERLTVRWLSKSTGEDSPAKFERLALSTDDDKLANMQFQIDFTLTGKEDHEPGSIELVFPAYIFKTRDGREMGELTMSLPEEPEKGADFAWRRAEDKIVVTNVHSIAASSKVMMQGTWRNTSYEEIITAAHEMVDVDTTDETAIYKGISDKLYAEINVETPNNELLYMKSNEVDASINTSVEATNANKTAYDVTNKKYFVYFGESEADAAGIPAAFKPVNPDDYVYVRWYVSGTAAGGQPFTMEVTDEPQDEYSGIVLGVENSGIQKAAEAGSRSFTAPFFEGYTDKERSAYVWTAYPLSSFQEDGTSYTLDNKITITVTGTDDKIKTSKIDQASVNVRMPITYTINKIWNDNNNAKGVRPSGVWVMIYRSYNDGNNEGYSSLWKYQHITDDGNGNYTYSWSDDGVPYSYSVYEYDMDNNGGTYGYEYDESGTRTFKWHYALESNDFDVDSHTWTLKNKYWEGWQPYVVSRFRKEASWSYQDSSLKSTRDSLANKLLRGQDAIVPFYVSGYSVLDDYTWKGGTDNGTVTAETVDEDIRFAGETLGADDVDIASISITTARAYEYADVDWSEYYWHQKRDGLEPVGIYGLKDGEWVKYAEYIFNTGDAGTKSGSGTGSGAGTGTLSAVNGSGASVSYNTVTFPEGVTKVKTSVKTGDAGIEIAYTVNVRVHPTNTVKGIVETALDQGGDYAVIKVYNSAKQVINDDNGNELHRMSSYSNAYIHARRYRVAASAGQSFKYVSNDAAKRELKLHVESEVIQQSNVLSGYQSEYDQAIRDKIIPNAEGGTFYDLLPAGVTPVINSVKLQDGDLIDKAYVIENYKDSGRTLLVVEGRFAKHTSYANPTAESDGYNSSVYPRAGYRNTQKIEFDCIYPWDEAMSYGIDDIRNVCAFESNEEWIGNVDGWKGEADDASGTANITTDRAVGSDQEIMRNLDTGRDDPSFVYSGAFLDTAEIDFSALTSVRKHVKAEDGSWLLGNNDDVNVQEGGKYSYRLIAQSSADTTTTDIILIDAIEAFHGDSDNNGNEGTGNGENRQWKGTLKSIDVSEIKKMGVAPVVYYSTVVGYDEIANLNTGKGQGVVAEYLASSTNWTSVAPNDLSNVKAIAIDCRFKEDGTPYKLTEDGALIAYLNMRAPEGDAAEPYLSNTGIGNNGSNDGENQGAGAYTYNDLWIDCKQVDELGRATHDYFATKETKIGIYSNYIMLITRWDDADDNDGLRPDSVTARLLKDGVDTGIQVTFNESNNWQAEIRAQRYNENGVEYGYTLELTDEIAGYTESNERSGNTYTLVNTHVPETIDFPVDIIWQDDVLEDGTSKRPDSVEVRLYADDVYNGTGRVVQASVDGTWTTAFNGINKYYDHGQEHTYTVQELEIEDYVTSYEDGGKKIINRYYPYGDLIINASIVNVTNANANQQFTFSISLKNTDGDNITGQYEYVKTKADGTEETGNVTNGSTLTMSNGESVKIKDIPSKTQYTVTEDREPGFGISTTGSTGIIVSGNPKTADFVNTYSTKGRADISAVKVLAGRDIEKYQFKFTLNSYDPQAGEGDVIAAATNGQIIGNSEDGKSKAAVTFSSRKYATEDADKTYWYVMKEEAAGKAGYTYSNSKYLVSATPHDNGDGTMNTEIHYYEAVEGQAWFDAEGNILCQEIDRNTELVFTNEYHTSGSFNPVAYAVMKPSTATLNADEYSFTMKDSGDPGTVIATATNETDGSVMFGEIRYDENDIGKTYKYYVTQDVPQNAEEGAIIYDTHIHEYTVKVIDNGDGTLFISQSYRNVDTDSEEIPVFTNKQKNGALTIKKNIDSASSGYDEDQEFTFKVKLEGDGEGLENGEYSYSVDPDAEVSFESNKTEDRINSTGAGMNTSIGAGINAYMDSSESISADIGRKTDTNTDAIINADANSIQKLLRWYSDIRATIVNTENNEFNNSFKSENNKLSENYDKTIKNNENKKNISYEKNDNSKISLSKGIIGNVIPIVTAYAEDLIASGTKDECSWKIESDGTLIIWPTNGVSGNITGEYLFFHWPWFNYYNSITNVIIENQVIINGGATGMFYGCRNLTSLDLSGLNTSNVTSMGHMFYNCSKLTSIDLSGYDTSNVTNMSYMFSDCSSLTSLDVSGFDTSNVTGMNYMFSGCSSLTSLDVSGFDTSNVTGMNTMFFNCPKLTSLDVSGFDTSNVGTMETMFAHCTGLTTLDVSGFDTSKVTSMEGMFLNCAGLTMLDASGFDTSKVKKLDYMFSECSNLTSLNISGFDSSNATDMVAMFPSGTKLSSIEIGERFTFNGNNITYTRNKALFPTPTGNQYTGKWIRDDQSYGPYTAEELRNNYTPAMAGTWIWESDSYSLKFTYPNRQILTRSGTPISNFQLTDITTGMNYYSLLGWTNNPSPDQSLIDELVNETSDMSYHFKDGNGYDVFLYHNNEGKIGECSSNYNILTIPAGTYSNKANITLYPLGKSITRTSTLTNGEMTVTIKGGERAVFSGLPAGTVYSIYEETSDGWTLVSQSNASGIIQPLTVSAAEFTNLYVPNEANAQFNARVRIEGSNDIIPEDNFSFALYEKTSEGDISSSPIQTASNRTGGMIQLDPITYTSEGIYEYILKEVINNGGSGNHGNNDEDDIYIYDESEKNITVTVTTVDGLLHAEIRYDDTTSDIPVFTNTLKPATLIISKEANGITEANKDTEFEFEVNLSNNNGMPIEEEGSYELYVVDNARQQVINKTGQQNIEYKHKDNVNNRDEIVNKTGSELISKGIIESIIPMTTAYAEDLLGSGIIDECSWKIESDGTLVIWPTNGVSGVIMGKHYSQWPWYYRYSSLITKVIIEDGVSIDGKANGMFNGFTNCTEMNLSKLDTSKMTSTENMFCNCSILTMLDLSGFDTSKVTNMECMFQNCRRLTTLDVSGFDTSKVTNMHWMFINCSSITSFDLSKFDTSNVTDMEGMFYECSGLTTLDLSGFNTSNVTDMKEMFLRCSNLITLDVSEFDTSKVTTMAGMFSGCSKLTTIDVSGFDTSNVTIMGNDFYSGMFYGCSSLTAIDVSGFNTSKVNDMGYMFCKCSSLTTLDISGFDTSNVNCMIGMFQNCSSLTTLDVSGIDTSSVSSMMSMFDGCSKLTTLDVSEFDTSSVTNMIGMFRNCSSLTMLDASGFDTSNVLRMGYMFYKCSSLITLCVSGFDTSNVISMEDMFCDCSSLISLDVSGFDTSKVTNMYSMFNNCSSLISLDISGFDTSKVSDMGYMFYKCSSLATLDISGFDTSNVTNAWGRFDECINLLSINLGENFSFKENRTTYIRNGTILPSQLSWIRKDHAYGPYSSIELRDNYNSDMAGTWVRYITENQAIIQFDGNGGTTTAAQIVVDNTEYSVDMPNSTTTSRPNYTLSSWNTERDGSGTSYAPGSKSSTIAKFGDITTLYAQWDYSTEHKYTVYHYKEDISNNTNAQSVTMNGKKYILADTDVLYTKQSSILPAIRSYSGYSSPAAQTIAVLENDSASVSYYYDAAKYTFHFDPNGGKGNMADQEIYVITRPEKLNANEFSKGNSLFSGWNTKADGSGVSYMNMQLVRHASWIPAGNSVINLYAQWIENDNEPKPYSNGSFTVSLKSGQSVVIKGLPAGSSYSVKEINIPDGWTQVNASGTSGELKPGKESQASFTNTYSAKGNAAITAHTNLIGGTPVSGQFEFSSRLEKVTVSTANVPYGIEVTDDGNSNMEWTAYSGSTEESVITLGQPMTGTLDIWWYNDNDSNPYDYISIKGSDGSGNTISEVLKGEASHKNGLYHSSYPVTASEITITSHVEYTTASDPESGYPYYGFYATFTPDNNSGSDTGTGTSPVEIKNNSSVDTNEKIAGNTEDDYIDNPWYNTAPARFETKTFRSPGVYEYSVREIQGNDAAIGEYDSHVETVVIKVSDNNDGTLNTEAIYDEDGCLFTNSAATAKMKVQSRLENGTKAAMDKEITYKLLMKDGSGNPIVNNIKATKSTGEIFDIPGGNGTFTLKADEYLMLENLPNGAVYEITEETPDGFELLSAENISGTINMNGGTTMPDSTLTNVYNTRGTAILDANLIYEGDDIGEGQFEFRLLDKNGNVVSTAYADTDGKIAFREIYFSKDDSGKEFTYFIEQIVGDESEAIFDTHSVEVIITVEDNGTSDMDVSVEYPIGNTFKNTRLSTLTVSKVMDEGKGDTQKDFQFDIILSNNDSSINIDGEYQAQKLYRGAVSDTTTEASASENMNVTFVSGKTSITLKAGESFIISGIPVGTEYLVTEKPDEYYSFEALHSSGTISKEGNKAIFANRLVKIDVPAKIEWDDADNTYGIRPEKVTLTLKADGKPIQSIEVDATDNWETVFQKVSKYDSEGAEIHYTVEENSIYGYTTETTSETIGGSVITMADTVVIKNIIMPETLDRLDTATLKISNSVDRKHEPFGDATFIYHISGIAKHSGNKIDIFKELTLDDLKTGDVEIEIPAGTYEITECNTSRYRFDGMEEDTSMSSGIVTVDGTKATVDFANIEDNEHAKAGVTFSNEMEQFEKYSHTRITINHV